MPDRDVFVLNDAMVRYLLMQRTEYRSPWHRTFKSALKKAGLPFSFDRALLWSERFTKRRIGRLYFESMLDEFWRIRRFIPATASSFLDIGAGLGGIDAVLYRNLGAGLALHILDKSGQSEQVYYGYAPEGAYYNQLSLTREFLLTNGVAARDLVIHDVDKDGYPVGQSFDVILSLKSWGFHYPVETYAEHALRTLAPDGVLVLDLRKETDGETVLSRSFRIVDRVEDDGKRTRIVARRQA